MRVLALASFLALAATSPMVAQGRNLDFELLNRTGLIIAELYVSPSDDNAWGEDVLGKDILKAGESVEIAFSRRETKCTWDLKIVDEDDDDVIWTDIDLCKASHITLRYENGTPTAVIK